jgi:hypothetical protein
VAAAAIVLAVGTPIVDIEFVWADVA